MELLSLEPQEDLVDLAVERYQRVADSGRGRLFFIAGKTGTGRSATLQLIGPRLAYADPPPLVVRGSLADGEFRDLSNRQEDHRQLLETLGGLVGLAAAAQPYLALVAAVMRAPSGLAKAREQLRKGKLAGLTQTEAPKLLLKLLREEAARRPVALLLDDVACLARDRGTPPVPGRHPRPGWPILPPAVVGNAIRDTRFREKRAPKRLEVSP